MHDLEFQNKSDIVMAHWHGFSDVGSGVKMYYWCVGSTNGIVTNHAEVECGIHSWEAVGLHTSVSRNLTNPLNQSKLCTEQRLSITNYSLS